MKLSRVSRDNARSSRSLVRYREWGVNRTANILRLFFKGWPNVLVWSTLSCLHYTIPWAIRWTKFCCRPGQQTKRVNCHNFVNPPPPRLYLPTNWGVNYANSYCLWQDSRVTSSWRLFLDTGPAKFRLPFLDCLGISLLCCTFPCSVNFFLFVNWMTWSFLTEWEENWSFNVKLLLFTKQWHR